MQEVSYDTSIQSLVYGPLALLLTGLPSVSHYVFPSTNGFLFFVPSRQPQQKKRVNRESAMSSSLLFLRESPCENRTKKAEQLLLPSLPETCESQKPTLVYNRFIATYSMALLRRKNFDINAKLYCTYSSSLDNLKEQQTSSRSALACRAKHRKVVNIVQDMISQYHSYDTSSWRHSFRWFLSSSLGCHYAVAKTLSSCGIHLRESAKAAGQRNALSSSEIFTVSFEFGSNLQSNFTIAIVVARSASPSQLCSRR